MKMESERNNSKTSSEGDDMNIFVSDLLHQMTSKFEFLSNQIMVRRI